LNNALVQKGENRYIDDMIGAGWTRPLPLFVCLRKHFNRLWGWGLIIAVSAAFLFAAVEPLRSFESETSGSISGAYYASQVTITGCLAVIQKAGEKTQNALSFRLALRLTLRLLISLGIYQGFTAFSKSPLAGNTQTNPISIKDSILLKLRI
jgi:hypothetical protein